VRYLLYAQCMVYHDPELQYDCGHVCVSVRIVINVTEATCSVHNRIAIQDHVHHTFERIANSRTITSRCSAPAVMTTGIRHSGGRVAYIRI